MTDLQTCLKNINADASFPVRHEDFDTDASWQHWQSAETSYLQQLMVAMVQANPERAKTSSDLASPAQPGSVYGGGIDSPIKRTPRSVLHAPLIPCPLELHSQEWFWIGPIELLEPIHLLHCKCEAFLKYDLIPAV